MQQLHIEYVTISKYVHNKFFYKLLTVTMHINQQPRYSVV